MKHRFSNAARAAGVLAMFAGCAAPTSPSPAPSPPTVAAAGDATFRDKLPPRVAAPMGAPPGSRLVPTPAVDGSVSALAQDGDTLYLAGEFSRVGLAVGGLAALDSTSAASTSYPP